MKHSIATYRFRDAVTLVADYDAHAAETCGDEAALKSAIDASREIRTSEQHPRTTHMH